MVDLDKGQQNDSANADKGDDARGKSSRLRRMLGGGLIEKLLDAYGDRLTTRLRAEMTQIARAEADRIMLAIQFSELNRVRNLHFATQAQSVRESADFAVRHMPVAQTFMNPHDTLRHALSLAPRGGMALEFGVFTGTTLRIIADTRKGQGGIYGFDSFEGLPEAWRTGAPKGTFAVDALPQVDGAELVKGWFDQSLPSFLDTHPGPVDFLHVDCDLYSSTRTVLDLVGPRLGPGSVVLFDEFFNYPGWQQHEYKAWLEFLDRTGQRCVYESYTTNGEQVAARIVA